MFHFIYKVTSKSGKYYIGRHSTKNLDDGYLGSGKWIRSLNNKGELIREIIEFCSEVDLLERERYYLNVHVGAENCMNFNFNPVGFSSGSLNPAHKPEEKNRRKLRSTGDLNPAKRADVRERMSRSHKMRALINPRKGWKMSKTGKQNISKGRTGIKYSDIGRKKLSKSRKREYSAGQRKVPSFSGQTHSEEYKMKMKEYYHSRPKKYCQHCEQSYHPCVFGAVHGEKCKSNLQKCA